MQSPGPLLLGQHRSPREEQGAGRGEGRSHSRRPWSSGSSPLQSPGPLLLGQHRSPREEQGAGRGEGRSHSRRPWSSGSLNSKLVY